MLSVTCASTVIAAIVLLMVSKRTKKNVEAARINRDLYEAEHERRSGGVIMVHVKGHSGDIGNDYADAFVQDGKGLGPFSRIQLSRGETQTEKCARHRTLSAMALPFELVTDA